MLEALDVIREARRKAKLRPPITLLGRCVIVLGVAVLVAGVAVIALTGKGAGGGFGALGAVLMSLGYNTRSQRDS
jgi:hypothetical protein